MKLNYRFHCNGFVFILVIALGFTLFHNALFFYSAWALIDIHNIHDVLFAATMPLVIFCALNIIFSVLAVPYIRKPLVITFLLAGAIANYFMYSFGVTIDGNMVENAFETNAQEVTALLTPRLILWLLLLGVIPSVMVGFTKIRSTRPWWYMIGLRAANIMVATMVILLIAALFYKDYASLIRNNKSIVKMLTPSNYVSATFQYTRHRYFTRDLPLIKIGEDAHKGPQILAQKKKTLVIFVLGETARAENFSLGGYERENNPKLKQDGVIYFKNTYSCGTETAISVPCMFSNMPRKQYDAALAKHQEGLMDLLAHAGVSVFWRDNDGGCKGACDRVPHQDVTQLKLADICEGDTCLDQALLHNIDNRINSLKDDGFIVLHQMGSHGPAYYHRYPAASRTFTPTCDSNQIQDCSHEQLVNTYDNSILYTDTVLDDTIKLLQQHSDKFNTVMVYISDHGESLGEKGIYLHGTPYMFAPSQQTHVPFLVWMSPDYEKNFGIDRQCLSQMAAKEEVSQDNIFHTMLGALNIQTTEYQPALDLMQRCRRV